MNEKIAPHQAKIDEYRRDFEENKAILLKNKMETKEAKRLRLEKERKEREERERKEREERERIEKERQEREIREKLKSIVSTEEFNQLEGWTSLKCSNVVCDTEKDGYPKDNTTTFGDKVINKNDLIFLIEDTEGNKFGEYLHEKIPGFTTVTDSNAFLFSLEDNNQICFLLYPQW